MPAAMAAPAMPRCISWARCCGTENESQKAEYLPRIANGELRLQAFGVTEPSSGTDTAGAENHRPPRRATNMSLTVKNSGPRGRSIPI